MADSGEMIAARPTHRNPIPLFIHSTRKEMIQMAKTTPLLLGIGEPLTGRLLLLDVLNMEWREVRLRKDPN